MKKYRFIGDGRGIPGIPHELTDAEALELGVEKELAEAVKKKVYEVIKEPVEAAPKKNSKEA